MREPAYPRKRTRLAPELRRESIVEAATAVFAERGLDAVTMDDVADAAGVAKGTVYLYFDSKENLVTALQARYADGLIAQAGALLQVGGRGRRLRRLDAFVVGIAAAYEANHRMYHVLFEAPGASEAAIMDGFRDLLRRFIADGADTGEFSVPDVDIAAEFLLQGIHGSLSRALHGEDQRRALSAIQQLARRTLSR
jgi:TetR/AcrR family transcriptional regulator, transcriptional repressor for nem operon